EDVGRRRVAPVNHHDRSPALSKGNTQYRQSLLRVGIRLEWRHYFWPTTTGASPDSISLRNRSSHGGSLRWFPRSGKSSSTRKPGPTVATSKSTPPGSLK